MKNLVTLRDELETSYELLKKGHLGINEAKARVSICNAILSSVKIEMERHKMVGEPGKYIEFTDGGK